VLSAASPASAAYPPLAAADGKPAIAAHRVSFVNDTVQLTLQVLAPGKMIEAVRIDNLGGTPSLWRSDGRDGAAPLAVSQGGVPLSTGSMPMIFRPGNREALLSLSLKDNGAFVGKNTDFRVTVFFTGGERVMYALNAGDFPIIAPAQITQTAPPPPAPTAAPAPVAAPAPAAPTKPASTAQTTTQDAPTTQTTQVATPAVTPATTQAATSILTQIIRLLVAAIAIINIGFIIIFILRKRLLDRAAGGDAQAQFAAFKTYIGKQNKLDLAMQFLSQSAEQGNADAQYELGIRYKTGYGVEQDLDKALELFEKSAAQGHSAAQLKVAECKAELG